jgi:hypothetical protein
MIQLIGIDHLPEALRRRVRLPASLKLRLQQCLCLVIRIAVKVLRLILFRISIAFHNGVARPIDSHLQPRAKGMLVNMSL